MEFLTLTTFALAPATAPIDVAAPPRPAALPPDDSAWRVDAAPARSAECGSPFAGLSPAFLALGAGGGLGWRPASEAPTTKRRRASNGGAVPAGREVPLTRSASWHHTQSCGGPIGGCDGSRCREEAAAMRRCCSATQLDHMCDEHRARAEAQAGQQQQQRSQQPEGAPHQLGEAAALVAQHQQAQLESMLAQERACQLQQQQQQQQQEQPQALQWQPAPELWAAAPAVAAAAFEAQPQPQPPAQAEAAAPGAGGDAAAPVSRVLTCRTYLKRLNVTKQMADTLLPRIGPGAESGARAPDRASRDAAAGGSYVTLFRLPVVLVDEAGGEHEVAYEGSLCGPQKHLRLTAGWPAFIRAVGADVGDALVFERRAPARGGHIHVRVARGAGGGGAAGGVPAAAAEEGGAAAGRFVGAFAAVGGAALQGVAH
jgi:hypothetical protein